MDNLTKQTILTILILCCYLYNLSAQDYLNLDFESRNTETNAPTEWYVAGNGYTISIDSVEKFNGEFSMEIESPKSGADDFGVAVLKLPFDNSKNRQVKFIGKIKTELLEDGYAGLWMRVDGINGTLKLDNMSDRGYVRTNNWSDAEINLSIDSSAIEIYFGAVVSGTGKAWFDGFEIFVDNVKHIDTKPMLLEPTHEELSWLKDQIYPLRTYIPAHENTSDLKVLDSLIGNSEVIAFGESTHGSSEVFKMKYRVIEYLAQKNKHNIFSIKANMPDVYSRQADPPILAS
jgi:erythromycin esterase